MPGRVVETRTFDRRIRFHCPDARLADLMDSLSALPEMPPPREPDLDIEISRTGPAHYDFDVGTGRAPGTARFTYERATQLVDRTFAAESSMSVTVLAASMTAGGRRILVLGEDARERQRFVLNCIGRGTSVETDRLVLLRGTSVFPMPNRPRVYEAEAALYPALAQTLRDAPRTDDWDGNIVHLIEPCLAGQRWRIMPAPVALILVLEQNGGGHCSAGRLSAEVCFSRLIASTYRRPGRAVAEFAALHILSQAAPCWKLSLGADSSWAWHLERILDG